MLLTPRAHAMKLRIEWLKPVPLRSGSREGLIYTLDLEAVPEGAGVYVFARRWGKTFEALYVGKAQNIRKRVRGQRNHLRLMRHVEDARNGRRVLIPALVHPRPGQQRAAILRLVERALIRHFLSEGHDLVNLQGTRIRRHEVESKPVRPKGFVPPLVYLERGRGE
jgi:hypothetical protein